MAKRVVRIHPKSGRASRLLPLGCVVNCANTSAKKAKIMAVYGLQGTKRRSLSAGVGFRVGVTIKKGPDDMKHKIIKAVVIRQVAPYTRHNIGKVRFEDNAVLLLDDAGLVRKGVIRGVVAREITSIPEFAELGAKIV